MTLFIATVTDDAGYLTQDTFCSAPNSLAAKSVSLHEDTAEVIVETYKEGGEIPTKPPIAFAPKIFTLPHLNAVIGGAGELQFTWAFASIMFTDPLTQDIADMEGSVQPRLAALTRTHSQGHGNMVIALGYSPRERRVIGFAFSSDMNFKPVRLSAGHSMMPAPDPSAEGYPSIADSWETAAKGVGVEAFHHALAWNQYQAYAEGKLPLGAGIGGQLLTAKVTPGEVSVRLVNQFPGFEEQRDRLFAA